ncbi:MAG TPA: hypothetical protein DCR97_09605 [Deltaproteobacteria bacterium]|nr:hypothetical protein [Deltaproteobacteria bacterium]
MTGSVFGGCQNGKGTVSLEVLWLLELNRLPQAITGLGPLFGFVYDMNFNHHQRSATPKNRQGHDR